MKTMTILAFLAALALAGCQTRSISDSGYRGDGGYYAQPGTSGLYRGELSEFDLLGVKAGKTVSEKDIADARDNAKRVTMTKGAKVLLIQSGAMIPDRRMIDRFHV